MANDKDPGECCEAGEPSTFVVPADGEVCLDEGSAIGVTDETTAAVEQDLALMVARREAGVMECVGGTMVRCDTDGPAMERTNGLDDDCDVSTNE